MMEGEVLYRSDTKSAPWTVIEATDRRFATVKIYMTVIHALAEAVEAVQRRRMEEQAIKAAEQVSGQQEAAEIMRQAGGELEMLQSSVLSRADLTLAYGKEEYEKRLKKLQKKIEKLHGEAVSERRIPVVIGFEGWDAGGKGGAIKRLTEKMDPRGYVVNPTAAPTEVEKAHHYLWRFWKSNAKGRAYCYF